MKLSYILVLIFCGHVLGNLVKNVHLIDHISYLINVITETVKEIEAKEWCNLKIPDAEPIAIDEMVLDRHAKGTVSYTNGFVVSIQEVDILQSTVNQQVNLNTDQLAQGIVKGTLRMHDVAIGYDVQANLEDGAHHYTAKYVHPLVSMAFTVTKIIDSANITVSVVGTVQTSKNLPAFMPSDRVSESLTILFNPAMSNGGIIAWATDIFQPIAEKVINKVHFPEVCYNCAA